SAASADSGNASLNVGWAWMVSATSSRRTPISSASEKAAESSETPWPTAWIPSTTWLSARATIRTKPSSSWSVMARPLARKGKWPTRISPFAGDDLGDHRALRHRAMGEHRLAGHIADRPDVAHRGRAFFVDAHERAAHRKIERLEP